VATWVSSDWHCQPGEIKVSVAQWIRLGREGNHRLIGDGDLFDILPLGRDKWKDSAAVKRLAELLQGYHFDYVAGNHDPYRVVKELMAPYPNIIVHKRLEVADSNVVYYVTHGHRWALDWGFLGLRHVAPALVEFMVAHAPRLWYWLCRRLGWLASTPRPGASESEERERITSLTRVIWAGAAGHALSHGCCVIVGHTHTTGRYERGLGAHRACCAHMVDGGNLPDGSFVEITDDARIAWLPLSP